MTHLKVCESDREIFFAIRLAESKSVTALPLSSRPERSEVEGESRGESSGSPHLAKNSEIWGTPVRGGARLQMEQWWGTLMIPEHQLGNRRQLHVGRAFVDFSDLGVPVILLHRIILTNP